MSGVYVKGFQLPEKNDLYYVKVECEPGKNPVATIWRKDLLGEMSFGAFEVIPVPDHGRLIDADELKKKHHWTDDFYETEYVEVEDIDAAPTIIPASEERE